MKQELLTLLCDVLRLNIVSENAFKTRFIGFKAEFYLKYLLQGKGYPLLQGGFLIPPVGSTLKTALDHSIYFTVISSLENRQVYEELYKGLAQKISVKTYLIVYENDEAKWTKEKAAEGVTLSCPEFRCYEFRNGGFKQPGEGIEPLLKNFKSTGRPPVPEEVSKGLVDFSVRQLGFADIQDLKDLYVQRLVFDFFLGVRKQRGLPLDIDLVFRKGNQYYLAEVKEKDPARSEKGFGMDLHRINDIKKIQDLTGLPYYLFIREIDNQIDRNFVAWKVISIDNFLRAVQNKKEVEGGYGMRSRSSHNATKICGYGHFRTYE